MATLTPALRQNQATALTWAQVDGNFSSICAQVNLNTAAIAALGAPQGGNTAGRPASPLLYQYYFDTQVGFPVWCSSISPVTWVNAAGVAA
jgi:hypothetical protein